MKQPKPAVARETAAEGNPAAMNYHRRLVEQGLPDDDQVIYGKVGAFGHLVHVTEVEG